MSKVRTVGIIRERGQLTIPEEVRKALKWAAPSSVVTISVEKPDEIRIQPHKTPEEINWDAIWNSIRLARSFKGKRGNLAKFIAEDRAQRS